MWLALKRHISAHLHICETKHFNLLSILYLHIRTSAHLHICETKHFNLLSILYLHIRTSAHLHIKYSSYDRNINTW